MRACAHVAGHSRTSAEAVRKKTRRSERRFRKSPDCAPFPSLLYSPGRPGCCRAPAAPRPSRTQRWRRRGCCQTTPRVRPGPMQLRQDLNPVRRNLGKTGISGRSTFRTGSRSPRRSRSARLRQPDASGRGRAVFRASRSRASWSADLPVRSNRARAASTSSRGGLGCRDTVSVLTAPGAGAGEIAVRVNGFDDLLGPKRRPGADRR